MQRNTLLAGLVVVLVGVFGCANQEQFPKAYILTVATAGEAVLVGASNTYGSAGNFKLKAVHGPAMTCEGSFRYVAVPRGIARFHCTNGESGTIRIRASRGVSGEGTGESSLGRIHIVFGYSLDEVNEMMSFPAEGMLIQYEQGIGFEPKDGR